MNSMNSLKAGTGQRKLIVFIIHEILFLHKILLQKFVFTFCKSCILENMDFCFKFNMSEIKILVFLLKGGLHFMLSANIRLLIVWRFQNVTCHPPRFSLLTLSPLIFKRIWISFEEQRPFQTSSNMICHFHICHFPPCCELNATSPFATASRIKIKLLRAQNTFLQMKCQHQNSINHWPWTQGPGPPWWRGPWCCRPWCPWRGEWRGGGECPATAPAPN